MRPVIKYILPPVLLIIVAFAGIFSSTPASAQTSSGQFNPQTQLTVGAKLQITSIYGLESILPAGLNFGNRLSRGNGQYGFRNQTSRNGIMNQQWNLTYLQNTPTANSSIIIKIQVTNDTQDGGVIWSVQGGSIAYNGTTLEVNSGKGGIGRLNRVLMVGNATDSEGNTVRWSLEGVATLYNGAMIASLTGNVSVLNQNATPVVPTQAIQSSTVPRMVLTYIATIT